MKIFISCPSKIRLDENNDNRRLLSQRIQTVGEEAVNNLYQQYTMLKNAIREMGGYEADEEID